MKRIFIAGTGTDIGKTFVTAALARRLVAAGKAVRVAKPIITGWVDGDNDTEKLLAAAGLAVNADNIAACSPWRFKAPLAADMAAALEGREVDFAEIAAFCAGLTADYVLVEGAGGVMSPVAKGKSFLDLIPQDAHVVLVAGSYLGSISHTLTALAALGQREITVVINESAGGVDLQETGNSLLSFRALPIFTLRRNHPEDINGILP